MTGLNWCGKVGFGSVRKSRVRKHRYTQQLTIFGIPPKAHNNALMNNFLNCLKLIA
jgi:hypothetical protein